MDFPVLILLIFTVLLLLGCGAFIALISVWDVDRMSSLSSIERRLDSSSASYLTRVGFVCLFVSLASLTGVVGILSR
jgi:hypothetical protein